jgi:hypothetical protein
MSPNNNTKTSPTALNSDLFISPPMNKVSGAGAGSTSLTTADASCHLPWPIAQAFGAVLNPCAGDAADTVALISLATPTNLWQSIHHGKQRQRQARSKETEENHSKTPPGTP